ncbi:MAG: long-chain-acyl-CoA synthetase [Pseudomonadales bacterium]
MGIVDTVRTVAQVPTLLALKKGMQPRSADERDCFAAQVQRNAQSFPDRTALIFEGRQQTWLEFNAQANRYAHAFAAQGLQKGDTVSVMMENRIEFLAVIVALNKLGVTAALINTNLRGRPLTHCVSVTSSRKCVFGEELGDALHEIKEDLDLEEGTDYLFVPDAGSQAAPNWATNLDQAAEGLPVSNPDEVETVSLRDNALYIFTSGTTGLPKAAVMSNRRFLASAGLSHKALFKCTEKDRMYVCLPLYHATGLMIGVGAAISSGASVFIRRRFSASNFLPEVREHNTNLLIYIGELCRYLMNTPAKPDDARNPLTTMTGNGLRPDIWIPFKKRFGIKRISEFYGASEGNVAFANLLNKDCTVGMTSSTISLVKYDVHNDTIVRDSEGHCIAADPGEPGLLLGQINETAVFEGYTDPEATEKKIIRNAFETGDAWFNSGDLMKQVDVGYSMGYPHYQFVDRVGDTFRWKSENVSTNEVGEILNSFRQIRFSNVYGVPVPGADGKAGMAALTLKEGESELDIEAFSDFVRKELPAYAQPVFLRVQGDLDVTGTFKMVKGDLREQAYDLDKVSDTLYVLKPGAARYVPLDREFAALISRGEAGY